MTPLPVPPFSFLFDQAYQNGYAMHGDLGLGIDLFIDRLRHIVEKHQEADRTTSTALSIITRLNTNDLYLSTACALPTDSAWTRFYLLYSKYILNLARFACRSQDVAEELTSGILSSMFLPDRSGRSRIASYDGQVSLSSWLRVVVLHKVRDEQQLKWNSVERLDCMPEIIDESAMSNVEAGLRTKQYEKIIRDSFQAAVHCLSERQRLILVLRYVEGYSALKVAEFLGVHASTISRQIDQIHKRLRREIVSFFYSKYRISDAEVRGCIADMLESPNHSLLAFLKQSS